MRHHVTLGPQDSMTRCLEALLFHLLPRSIPREDPASVVRVKKLNVGLLEAVGIYRAQVQSVQVFSTSLLHVPLSISPKHFRDVHHFQVEVFD